MVKTPRTRHSRTTKEPVTIDLAPGEVSRAKAEAEKKAEPEAKKQDAAAAQPESAKAEPEKVKAEEAPEKETTFGRQEDKPSSPPPAAEPTPSRGGALAGGVAGGVIALVIAGGLQLAGLGGSAQQDDSGPAIAALETQLAGLRDEMAALGASEGGDPALDGRVTQAEERAAALASELETLRGEVAGLGEQAGGEATPIDLGPLEQRIATLETATESLGDTGPSEALNGRVEALTGEVAAARDVQQAATARLDALEQALGELTGRVEEAAETPATAVIIAASALKAAIDRGAAFTTEMETFASLAPDAPEIAELRALAAGGVPTRAQIASESDAAANAMIAAARPVDPEAGVIDRLWASATNLVQVRPVGMVEGDGVPEIVARLDAAVEAGDYERALAEYETLPEAAKAAGEAFAARLRARHGADRLIDAALAAALKA